MARRPRGERPGRWHHVINRAIAKRPYFETRSDKRYFLARLASEVRAGRLEVHAFSLLTTHFHLLVRSPIGELSEGMRRVQHAYSRYFNRLRRRDGPLIRARFYSKPVDTDAYRRAVVRYIDANAVRAGVAAVSAKHEFGSARFYLVGRAPIWLSTGWVKSHALQATGAKEFGPSAYLRTFGFRQGEDYESLAGLIELRMASTANFDALDDLIGKTPQQVRQWMIRKAHLADGMPIGLPVCGPSAVHRAVDQRLQWGGEWLVEHRSRTFRGSVVARAGLLKDLCGLPFVQVAKMQAVTPWMATRQVEVHREALVREGDYAAIVTEILQVALKATVPG